MRLSQGSVGRVSQSEVAVPASDWSADGPSARDRRTEDDVKPGAKGRGGTRSGLFCHLYYVYLRTFVPSYELLQTKYPCVQVGYE